MVQQAKQSFLDWLQARLQERTTAAGIGVILGWLGVHVGTDTIQAMIPAVSAGLVLVNSSR